jgi:dGTPase
MAIKLKALSEPNEYGEGLRPGERLAASYAASAVASLGRVYPEPECPTRSPFQRDRDRILHATSFRRLTYKTQVFLFHEGDHYRSRLTHSLEVAQIARTIARQLRLDEDLAEALALAHDLGHSPFGHAGERALDSAMQDFGGFDHNAQSVRVVTHLERKYLAFDGLNLTWETLEGLVKHNGPVRDRNSTVAKSVRRIETWKSLDLESWASAEAQAASLADDIAYLSHDVDDGLRAGLLTFEALASASLAGPISVDVARQAQSTSDGRAIYEVTRRMIKAMVADVVTESRHRLQAIKPQSPSDIRHAGNAVVAFSPDMTRQLDTLKEFLFAHVYRHPKVVGVMANAESIVTALFKRYLADPATMPESWSRAAQPLVPRKRARLVSDFVSGQTDRYAIAEHRRLFGVAPDLR